MDIDQTFRPLHRSSTNGAFAFYGHSHFIVTDAENRESDSDQEEQAQPTGHVEPVDDLHKDFDLHATQIPIMKNEMQRPESKTPEDEEKLDSKTPEDGERLDSKTPEDEERLESKTPEDEAYNEPDEGI